MERIRVLVVDDSAVMRSAIKGILHSDPGFEVIATARDGQEAIDQIRALKPDIVTMDLEMPRMDGLTALKIIMEEMPLPVLVLSSLTSENAEITFRALDLGAADYVCKDFQSDSVSIEVTLISKLKEIARHRDIFCRPVVVPAVRPGALTIDGHGKFSAGISVVAIGVSTGGPKALQDVIPLLPKNFPVPVLVVQHMPAQFTKTFADRMNSMSQLKVKEAEPGDIVEPGTVFIARGGIHMKITRPKALEVLIELDSNPTDVFYRPSVDVMMSSVVNVYRGRTLGVIMTGMGNDGTRGMREIRRAGGRTLAQDEASSIVFGMPKCAIEAGVVDRIVPLADIAKEIIGMIKA